MGEGRRMDLREHVLTLMSRTREWRVVWLGLGAIGAGAAAMLAYMLAFNSSSPRTASADIVVVNRAPATDTRTAAAGASTANVTAIRKGAGGGDGSEAGLGRALQAGLRRAGCYDGAINGVWSRQSAEAMARFLALANARLPVDQPDQILLATLESNSAVRCGAASPATAAPPVSNEAPPIAMPVTAPARVEPIVPPMPVPVPRLAIPPPPAPAASVPAASAPAAARTRDGDALVPTRPEAPAERLAAPPAGVLPRFAAPALAPPPSEAAAAERTDQERPSARRARLVREAPAPHRHSAPRRSPTTFGKIARNVSRGIRSFSRALASIVN